MPDVLAIVPPGAEEIETMAVADVLVRAGCTVRLAMTDSLVQRGSRNLPMAGDLLLDDCLTATPDALFLPGGMPAAERNSQDERIQDLIAAQLIAERWLAIICASPLALLPRGLAAGRRLTSYPSLNQRFAEQGQWIDAPVVIDRPLITSQGPGTAIDLGLHLAAALVSPEVAAEVASALLTTYTPLGSPS